MPDAAEQGGCRVLFYAPGGGLGHVQRALAVARRLPSHVTPVVLTTSPFGCEVGSEGLDVRVLGARGDQVLPALRFEMAAAACHALVVDCFAAGPAGELWALREALPPRRALLLRCIESYAPAAAPAYELVLSVEAGAERGAPEGVRVVATGPVLIRRIDELPSRSRARALMGLDESDRRCVLLVLHHGYPGEAAALGRLVVAAAAAAPGWVVRVASLRDLEDAGLAPLRVCHWPAMELLPGADAVVAGGGYASCHEVAATGVAAVHVPMGRRHDAQGRRVRALGHGVVASTPDDLLVAVAGLMAGAALPPATPDPSFWDGAGRAATVLTAWLNGSGGR